jgi:predicted ATP-grasp superfamily ATP-dependent carboligase
MQIAAERLLSAVDWRGVAMIEFRVTRGGDPYLMEINGRFWGSLQLAVDCGVDFPWLTYQLLTDDGGLQPQTNYPLGQRLRWVVGDFDNLLIQLRSNQIDLAQRAAAVAQFTRAFVDPSIRQEILRMSDPRPAWHELRSWLGALRQ